MRVFLLISFAIIFVKILQNFASTKIVLKIESNFMKETRETETTDRKFLSHCLSRDRHNMKVKLKDSWN